ncbi:helix-turn-helix transcriptional regulator [Fluviicola sp.]|uniref:helix-turn-helix domain-containing protein n=1 Tax=Fluviicola sp. TaxID=1917219 RepID=UPI0031CF03A1
MKFETYFPNEKLKHYISHFAVSENEFAGEYKVFPSSGLVIGFQYKGELSTVNENGENKLNAAGISGIFDTYKVFKNSSGIGTFLVYFTEIGFAHFASRPVNELFNLSISLEDVFEKQKVREVEEKLSAALTDKHRIRVVEQFLVSQLKDVQTDKLIVEAVRRIYESKGTIRIRELNEQLFISQSPFEKRFRKVVGTTPKKFASIIRFNALLEDLKHSKSLTEICYENHFFDQAHFIKEFKHFTGDTPENFKRKE